MSFFNLFLPPMPSLPREREASLTSSFARKREPSAVDYAGRASERRGVPVFAGTTKVVAFAVIALLAFASMGTAQAEKVRDLAQVAGVRQNQLVGYGLVAGLDGSGDQTSQTPFTTQSIDNMLQQFGITVPPNVRPQLKNVAAVMVTADLPPFAKPGQAIDITVASIGNSKSLRGGSLLMTPLKGADGQVYAVAQGNVVIEGEAGPDTMVSREADAIEIEAEALSIPEQLTVSIEGAAPGTQFTAGQITLPPGVNLISDPDMLVVNVVNAPTAADLEEEGAGEAAEAPEGEAAAAEEAGEAGEASAADESE